jgi:hypothetical protein
MDLKRMVNDKLPEMAITQVVEAGGYVFITWAAHLRAWIIYDRLFKCGQTAERLADRGGFGKDELDAFYPEWRNHIYNKTTVTKD